MTRGSNLLTASTNVQQVHIQPLTSLRFTAAMYVVLYHTLPDKYRTFAHGSIVLGYSSVSFFFILSGFVLAIAYAQRVETLDRRKFWRARFARIYPLYLLTICLDVPNLLWARFIKYGLTSAAIKTLMTLLATLLMLQAWWPERLEGIDNPNWSLSVETVFYFLFPFIAGILWQRTAKSALLLLSLLYLGGVFLISAAIRLHLPEEMLIYLPVLHLMQFAVGILLAKVFLSLTRSEERGSWLRRLTIPILLVVLAGFWCIICWPHIIPKPILHDGGLLLLFGPLILVFAGGHPLINKFFSHPFLVLLGEASYGLYLLHMVLWHYLSYVIASPIESWLYMSYLVAAVALSVVSFRYFEQPARTWINGLSSANKAI